jgi:hypothetical protein
VQKNQWMCLMRVCEHAARREGRHKIENTLKYAVPYEPNENGLHYL